MPVDTSNRLVNGDHVVHFYDGVDDLVAMVGGYLVASVLDGDAVIVVAVPAHRDALQAALVAAGIDVEAAQHSGELQMLDPAETLDRFMIDGLPDARDFADVVGGIVAASGLEGREVRVYGEMVAVLWNAGNVAGAVELERLWNELGTQLPFSLFCAYPVDLMLDAKLAAAFQEVCHLHSDRVVGAPTPAGAEVSRRFAGTFYALRPARRFAADTLHRWGLHELVDDAMLVLSELATNAVVHAGSDFTVALSRFDRRVLIAVADTSSDAPCPRDADFLRPGGRGLRLVDSIASRWGHDAVGTGKVVWAELTVGDAAVRPAQPSLV